MIVQGLSRTIHELRRRGYTIVMVEQNFRFAAPLADRFYIMEHGRIVQGFAAAELQDKMALVHEYPRRLILEQSLSGGGNETEDIGDRAGRSSGRPCWAPQLRSRRPTMS